MSVSTKCRSTILTRLGQAIAGQVSAGVGADRTVVARVRVAAAVDSLPSLLVRHLFRSILISRVVSEEGRLVVEAVHAEIGVHELQTGIGAGTDEVAVGTQLGGRILVLGGSHHRCESDGEAGEVLERGNHCGGGFEAVLNGNE